MFFLENTAVLLQCLVCSQIFGNEKTLQVFGLLIKNTPLKIRGSRYSPTRIWWNVTFALLFCRVIWGEFGKGSSWIHWTLHSPMKKKDKTPTTASVGLPLLSFCQPVSFAFLTLPRYGIKRGTFKWHFWSQSWNSKATQFSMNGSGLISNHFLGKDSESSNWNHHLFK